MAEEVKNTEAAEVAAEAPVAAAPVIKQRGKSGRFIPSGIAYVLDAAHDLYLRLNKQMVTMSGVTERHDAEELRRILTAHAAATGSRLAKEILADFDAYLPKFKKIIPHDYERMLKAIVQMEEKGLSAEQAQIEAFYANKNK